MVDEKSCSTREQIILLLKRNVSMSVSDLAKCLDITEMAVRRHLHTLERDMIIRSTLVRQAMGRPSHLYSLTEVADAHFPNNYEELLHEFLEDLEGVQGKKQVEHFFQRREERMRADYLQRISPQSPLSERVEQLVAIQNERGYMAEWERDGENRFIIRELHCPIGTIARKYEKACHCELQLFTDVLRAQVERTQCMALGTGDHCVYMIEEQ